MINQKEIAFYRKIIAELSVVFDVGCHNDNIFHELNPSLEIHLFEPDINCTLIDAKIKGKKNIRLNRFALGNNNSVLPFHYAYGSFLERDNNPKFKNVHHLVYDVQITTLEQYCSENQINHIDLLKIDTEGYDFEVIQGAGNIINNIDYIQFEVFPYYANGKTLNNIIEYFKTWNIYSLHGKPENYVITKKTLDYLDIIKLN